MFKPRELTESTDAESGCIYCTSHQYRNGIIILQRNNEKMSYARYKYEQKNGKIPEGYCVRHTCGNSLCGNPDHMNVVELKDRGFQAGVAISDDVVSSLLLSHLRRLNLTVDDVRAIYMTPAEIQSIDIAIKYNVSTNTIISIRKGKSFSDLTYDLDSPIFGKGLKGELTSINKFKNSYPRHGYYPSDKEIEEIKKEDANHKYLAKKYNTSVYVIKRIKNGTYDPTMYK